MLTTENLCFSYNREPFLENISIGVNDGEYVGIIGPNGSGKSTLIKLFAGLLNPNKGNVKIRSDDL